MKLKFFVWKKCKNYGKKFSKKEWMESMWTLSGDCLPQKMSDSIAKFTTVRNLLYNIYLISISDSVFDQATKMSVLNLERVWHN